MTRFLHFVGIDPGQYGAVCVLNDAGHIVLLADIPDVTREGPQGLVEMLKEGTAAPHGLTRKDGGVSCCVELVESRPTDGLRGLARFMRGAGIIEGVCVCLFGERNVGLPRPQVWRRAYQLRGQGKEGSMRRAQGLVGSGVKFTRHDEAEAYLLARFAWLNRERWGALCMELRGAQKGAGLTKGKRKKPLRASCEKGRGNRHATQKRMIQEEDPGDVGALVVEVAD